MLRICVYRMDTLSYPYFWARCDDWRLVWIGLGVLSAALILSNANLIDELELASLQAAKQPTKLRLYLLLCSMNLIEADSGFPWAGARCGNVPCFRYELTFGQTRRMFLYLTEIGSTFNWTTTTHHTCYDLDFN